MNGSIRVSAKTVDDAITEAMIQLGVTSDRLEYEVIEKGSSGFLGIGMKQAVIEARRKPESEPEVVEEEPFAPVEEIREEKAEEIAFKQTLFRKLQRFSDENGGNEINWLNTNQQKFFITYYYDTKELDLYYVCNDKDFGQVYFISEEIAEKAIELFRDELIKYFTHDWSGKDETPINLNSEER